MPAKKKLKLADLKIQSFVTSLEKKDRNKVKGGTDLNVTFRTLCPLPCTMSEDLDTCDPRECTS